MWNAAYYLVALALECDDLALAREWAPLCMELGGDASLYAARAWNSAFFMARIHFMEGKLEKSRESLEVSRDLHNALPKARGHQSLLALDALLRYYSNDSPLSEASLAQLHQLHLRARDTGTQDFEAAGLFTALMHSKAYVKARSLCDHYMRVRRSRVKVHSALRDIQLALGYSATNCFMTPPVQT